MLGNIVKKGGGTKKVSGLASMSPSNAFSMLKGTLERWDSVDAVLFADLATEPADW